MCATVGIVRKAHKGFLKNFKNMTKLLQFLQEAYAELRRVTWPTREQVVQYTILVIIISLITALILGALDYIFGGIIRAYILN